MTSSNTDKVAAEEQPNTVRSYELSAVSEYYIYGRGNAEDYARAIHRVREDLREAAYGEKQEIVPEKTKRFNGAAIAIAILSLLTVATFAIGYFLPSDSFAGFIGKTETAGIGSVAAEAILLWVSVALAAITFLVSLFRVKRRTGGLLRFTAILTFLCLAGMAAISFIGGNVPGTGVFIMCALSFASAIAACVGKYKRAEE